MSSGVSGTKGSGGRANTQSSGTISAAKVSELEKEHQKFLDSMRDGRYTLWEEGAESGARAILGDLAGKQYSVSRYNLTETASYAPVSIKEVEKNLDMAIRGYEDRTHDQWSDGYYSQAVRMLELATGNKYSMSGYRLTKVSPATSTTPAVKAATAKTTAKAPAKPASTAAKTTAKTTAKAKTAAKATTKATKTLSAGDQFKKQYGLRNNTAASFMRKYKVKAKDVDFEHGDGSVIHFGIGTRKQFVDAYKDKKVKDVYNKYGMTIFRLDD